MIPLAKRFGGAKDVFLLNAGLGLKKFEVFIMLISI